MEGKIWLNLANPLTLLGVHGYDEPPLITDCKIKIFISSDLDDQTFDKLTEAALRNCFIYNTLNKNVFLLLSCLSKFCNSLYQLKIRLKLNTINIFLI